MTDTIDMSDISDPKTWSAPVTEKVRRAAQQQFLLENHHLISPWMYTPEQYAMRNRALFLREFDKGAGR